MNSSSKKLSIIAYYLSEFDMDAVTALGYRSRRAAFNDISEKLGRDNNYLKLRRDEFDALPDSSSHRNGWNKRPPAKDVVNLAAHLKTWSFDELTELVKSFFHEEIIEIHEETEQEPVGETYTESELENAINIQDPDATIKLKISPTKIRLYKTSVIHQLKKLYGGRCQICGAKSFPDIGTDRSEAHHIEYFSVSQNNDSDNIIILCPNHHRLIHKLNPMFVKDELTFMYDDGKREKIILNFHL